MESLERRLGRLRELGCFPCISYRGNGVWRAHVNGSGNYWADAITPSEALARAIESWEAAGRTMDGYAASTSQTQSAGHRAGGST